MKRLVLALALLALANRAGAMPSNETCTVPDDCTVTTTAGDTSAGSLRACMASSGSDETHCRRVKFNISGSGPVTIKLDAPAELKFNQLISGNSNQGRPIIITGAPIECDYDNNNCHNSTVRFLNFRGDGAAYCLNFTNGAFSVIVHHISCSGYSDTGINIKNGANRIHVKKSIIRPGSDNEQNYGFLVKDQGSGAADRINIHHNLIYGTQSRNPECYFNASSDPNVQTCAFWNNTVWNFHRTSSDTNKHAYGFRGTGHAKSNVRNNWFYSTTETSDYSKAIFNDGTAHIYANGNLSFNSGVTPDSANTESGPFTAITGESSSPSSVCDMITALKCHAGPRAHSDSTTDQDDLDDIEYPSGCSFPGC